MSKTAVELTLSGVVDLNDDLDIAEAMEAVGERARQVLLDRNVFLSIDEEAITVERSYADDELEIEEDDEY